MKINHLIHSCDPRSRALLTTSCLLSVALCSIGLVRRATKPLLFGGTLFVGGTLLARHIERDVALPPDMLLFVGEMPWEVPLPFPQSAKTIAYCKETISSLLPTTPVVDCESQRTAIVEIPSLKNLSLDGINSRIRELNRKRLSCWRELSPELDAATAWDRPTVQEKYEKIVTLTAQQVETTVRFYELCYESDAAIGHAIEQQDLLGHFTLYGLMQKTMAVGDRRMHHSSPIAREWQEEGAGSLLNRALWDRHCGRVRPYIEHMTPANQPRYSELLKL